MLQTKLLGPNYLHFAFHESVLYICTILQYYDNAKQKKLTLLGNLSFVEDDALYNVLLNSLYAEPKAVEIPPIQRNLKISP